MWQAFGDHYLAFSQSALHFAGFMLLQSSLLVCLGLIGGRLARGTSAALESTIYRLTLAAVMLCPAVSLLFQAAGMRGIALNLPAARSAPAEEPIAEIAPPSDAPSTNDTPVALDMPQNNEIGTEVPAKTAANPDVREKLPASPISPSPTPSAIDWTAVAACSLTTIWLLGSSVLLIRLLCAWRLTRSLMRSGCVADAKIIADCRVLAERMNVRCPMVIRSPFTTGPMLAGIRRPAIILPEEHSPETQGQEILVHELAHLARRDVFWNLLGRLATAFLFFQPLLWYLTRRITISSEEVCDDYIVHFGLDQPGYAQQLFKIAERHQPSPAAGVGVISLRSFVGRRVARILDSSRSISTRVRKRTALMVVFLSLAATCLISMLTLGDARAIAETEGTAIKDRESGAASANGAVSNASDAAQAQPDANAASPKTLSELMDIVRRNEALFKNLDCSVQITYGSEGRGAPNFGQRQPNSAKPSEETWRMAASDGRSYFKGEAPRPSGNKTVQTKWISVFDGRETVTVEENNSVTVHQGRYEHSRLLPPHTLPLLGLDVNFPLSVYLEGTKAMRTCPKVRCLWGLVCGPNERNIKKEDINRVEAEVVGEEKVEGLDCIKVRIRSWYKSAFPPEIQLLWLAKERNYHVVQWQASFVHGKAEILGKKGRVGKWLALAKGVWLPAVVESTDTGQEAHAVAEMNPLKERHVKLTVKKATLDPKLPEDFFKLPKIPDSLPKFVMDKSGRLIDQPSHPTPVKAEKKITLDEILDRLAEEEKRYDDYEVALQKRYLTPEAANASTTATHRNVFKGGRYYHEEEQTVNWPDDESKQIIRKKLAFDGKWTRYREQFIWQGHSDTNTDSAGLYLTAFSSSPMCPHTIVDFLTFKQSSPWLSKILRPDRTDSRDRSKLIIEYLGDERVGDLYCHKLKVQNPRMANSDVLHKIGSFDYVWYVWLARDRNFLPVRYERHLPVMYPAFPRETTYMEDLREIRSGLWYPYHTTTLRFRDYGDTSGFCENRLIVNTRISVDVKKLTVSPAVNGKLFSQLEVSQGTFVHVSDEQNQPLGSFKQAADGNIDISADELQELSREKITNGGGMGMF